MKRMQVIGICCGALALAAFAAAIGPPGSISGGGFELRGVLTRSADNGAVSGGGFVLRGSLIPALASDSPDGETDEKKAGSISDQRSRTGADRRVRSFVTDGEGFFVPGSETLVTLAHDALPALVNMDINGDSLVDYFALREDHESLTALIAREDGRFDLLVHMPKGSLTAALPRGEALDNATIFSPHVAENDEAFDAEARDVATFLRAAEEVLRDGSGARASDSAPLIVEIDDFDADGNLDFAISDPETGETAYLHVEPDSAGDADETFERR